MKQKTTRLSHLLITVTIAALLLTGAVPSFAWGPWSADAPKAGAARALLSAGDAEGDAADAVWSAAVQPVYAAEEETAEEQTSVVLPAIEIDASDAPKIHGRNAIIMDLDTGTVLYEKKADQVVEPASVTKILTFLVAVETLDPDQVVTVPDDVETEGSVIWLEPGEEITVGELYYGMMLESGNDAAQVLGLTAGDGDLDKFSEMMNRRAKECGATNTDFANPNGLNEDRDHLNYTSARDLALIAREAMNNPTFREVVGTSKHTIPATNKSKKRTLYNSNLCLWQKYQTTVVNGEEVTYKYKGCNGLKTGFTSDAGFCYVGSADRKNTDFLVVTMGSETSEERYQDAIMLWDYAFSKYETYPVQTAGQACGLQRVWGGEKRSVEVATGRDVGVTIEKGTADAQNFTTEFRLDQDKAQAPITKGQKLGQALVFNAKGRLVGAEDLYAMAAVPKGGPLSNIGIADEDLPQAFAIAGGVVLLILLIIFLRRARRRRARLRERESIRGELATMRTAGTGMTARELTDLTGVKETVPIPRGPARISDEELTAWTSTKKRRDTKDKRDKNRETNEGRYAGSRFGGRSPRGGYGKGSAGQQRDSYPMPKMQITPRTPLTGGSGNGKMDQPLQRGSMTDEELFSMLESTKVYDANQPRRHGKLTDTERHEVMRRTRRGHRVDGKTDRNE